VAAQAASASPGRPSLSVRRCGAVAA
jgi:hypothetical protein